MVPYMHSHMLRPFLRLFQLCQNGLTPVIRCQNFAHRLLAVSLPQLFSNSRPALGKCIHLYSFHSRNTVSCGSSSPVSILQTLFISATASAPDAVGYRAKITRIALISASYFLHTATATSSDVILPVVL